MTNRLLLFILLCLNIAGFCNQPRNNKLVFNRVSIHFVHPGIATFMRISCGGFETSFGSTYKKIERTDTSFIKQLQNCLTKGRPAFNTNIDVRTKVLFFNNAKLVATYCMDRSGDIMVNNEYNMKNSGFVELIYEATKEKFGE